MIKVFTLNKNNKIELTKKELEQLLNESYWDGYRSNNNLNWVYTSPSITTPHITYTTSDTTLKPYTIDSNTIKGSITINSSLGD